MAQGGSSPLARGTLRHRLRNRDLTRFIPARAGNTRHISTRRVLLPVHPRSRGEHSVQSMTSNALSGSSPLARGTQSMPEAPDVLHRFIPARAGNTLLHARHADHRAVHPRSRGEHIRMSGSHRVPDGSSPLARGTRGLERREGQGERFIPARAGNTRPPDPSRPHPSVHPRSRGEHLLSAWPDPPEDGSSPLARGTRIRPAVRLDRDRFIPARAGNTARRSVSRQCQAVHPRSRGEHG